jgi:hypothetical protein
MDSLHLKESDKGSEASGSDMSSEDIKKERLKIIELSNESVLHGYDMAAEILTVSGNTEGLTTLMDNRAIIELGLKNGAEQRAEINIEGNISVGSLQKQDKSSDTEESSSI